MSEVVKASRPITAGEHRHLKQTRTVPLPLHSFTPPTTCGRFIPREAPRWRTLALSSRGAGLDATQVEPIVSRLLFACRMARHQLNWAAKGPLALRATGCRCFSAICRYATTRNRCRFHLRIAGLPFSTSPPPHAWPRMIGRTSAALLNYSEPKTREAADGRATPCRCCGSRCEAAGGYSVGLS